MTVSLPAALIDPESIFPFELDEFQQQAITSLDAGRSVVVCAPTGSGKTLIGEYAIHRALASGRRVFYTTPLKALSNQKLRDFRHQFGPDAVGLLTGDLSINREAPILVMTTEIFRNMLYGTPIGEVGTSLVGVETVVLDECHYMNDRQRGTVWEEAIIYCPPSIQLVALSATVANSDQLTDWIAQVHGPTDLIYSDFRPVPLEFFFCNLKGIFPLLDKTKQRVNPQLKLKGSKRDPKQQRKAPVPTLVDVVTHLQEREMLPAIYFIFSRRGCDKAVDAVGEELTLVNAGEADTLQALLSDFIRRNPELAGSRQLEALSRGIAVHHAGILPAWKSLVEELFQAGLIKVVFATETLAAGINMPARTTVISSLSKRTDAGHRLLNPSEFLQMAGRAGRRGMDEIGYVVTVQTRFEGTREAVYLATTGADPLVSQFAPSYGMVLNLLQTHTLDETRELIERSFGQYLATLYLRPQQQAITHLQEQIQYLEQQCDDVDWDALRDYEKLRERLKEEHRLLKILQHQHQELHSSDLAVALTFAIAGTILRLKGEHIAVATPLPAVLVTKVPGSGQFPYLVCIGQDARWYVVAVADVVGLHAEFPRIAAVDQLELPPDLPLKLGQSRKGSEQVGAIATQIPHLPALDIAPEVEEQLEQIAHVQALMDSHPAQEWHHNSRLMKAQRRMQSLRAELQDRETKLANQSDRYWIEFVTLIEILQEFGGLEDVSPTEAGKAISAIRGDNELWLGLALLSGELDDLEPQEFAAACAALVTEVSRPDSWSNYEVSAPVHHALGVLRSLRRHLFQTQRRYQVTLPIWLELDFVGLVEQWASGIEWTQMCANTSLDEGDLVRILRRTLDFLSQIPHVQQLSPAIHQTARDAMRLIDRFPVNENTDL